MKTKILLSVFFTFSLNYLGAQVPQGFNYQAIARDGSGNPIINTSLPVTITIQSEADGGTIFWKELHSSVTSNNFGMISLVVGKGVRQAESTAGSFEEIDWAVTPKFIKTEIFYQSVLRNMGSSELWSVPYAAHAGKLTGTQTKLGVKGITTSPDSALFEVKNLSGQTVFAVYNEGVRVYVDDGNKKGAKGGFSIGGFGLNKAGESQPFFAISPDSARIYVKESAAKGRKGGFSIGGFDNTKGTITDFMFMTPQNYFVGHQSGELVTTSGIYNSTLGYQSGMNLTDGSNNVFVGYKSGISNNVGSYNVLIGNEAGYKNTSGNFNIMLGRGAGYNNSTAYSNIFLGDLTAYFNDTGDQNVMIGDWAGYHNTEGSQNVFLGATSGWNNTTGSNNIFMGFESGYTNTLGFDNIAIGNKAGRSNLDGTYNVMIGSDAGNMNVTGDYNTLVGYKAGEKVTGDYGTMLGYLAGNATLDGISQTMLGYEAGFLNTGAFNTYVGVLAGGNSGAGKFNTYLGIAAGNYATGDNNVFIGKWAGWAEAGSNKLVIENNYSEADNYNNALIYGDFESDYVKINGNLSSVDKKVVNDDPGILGVHNVSPFYGIGVQGIGGWVGVKGESTYTGLSTRIGVWGNAQGGESNYGIYGTASGTDAYAAFFDGDVTVTGTFSNLSDKILKKNIVPLTGSLSKILNLQGVTYIWKSEVELASIYQTKGEDKKEIGIVSHNFPEGDQLGVIAQDVEKILPELVHTDGNGYKSVDYIKMIPVLIEAIKEQQRQIEELKTIVETLMINQPK